MSFAVVFPGQGSQSVGMLSDVANQSQIIKQTFAEASAVLDYDLWALVQNGPEDKLNQTEFTQPALMAADIALWRYWCDTNDARPQVLAGHSLGEFVAFVAADAIDFKDAVKLVRDRGRFMQAAVANGVGAMAAIIGLDNEKVQALCDDAAQGEVVSPANFNSIGQVVIAGDKAAVERAVANAKPVGAKLAKLIPVSVPSHCALMQPAAEQFKKTLDAVRIQLPSIPVIQNVDAKIHDDVESIRQALINQLTQPVQWVATIQAMQAQGVTEIIECGPGKVLQGLIKRIDRNISLQAAGQ